MARKPKSMRQIKEVLRLKHEQRLSVRQIARNCGLPSSTVSDYLVRAQTAGLGWPLPEGLDEQQIQEQLLNRARGQPQAAPPAEPPRPLPDWPEVHKELGRRSVTLRLLWREYRQRYPEGYAYTQFCEYYHRWAETLDPVMRHHHPPGEKMFVDWAGQTVPLHEAGGAVSQASVFIAVLGASNKTFARAFADQKLPSWIMAHCNGKQESWWNQVEGRLLPMLEGVPDLTLAQLNEATLAWLEVEYHRRPHSQLDGRTPLQCFVEGRDVGRPAPDPEVLRQAFTAEITRTQRRSDGTLSLLGQRFEIPSRYRHFARVQVRYASWDLSQVHLVDPHTGTLLCRLYPLDKARNAEGHRAAKPSLTQAPLPEPASGMAPLLQKILRQYATTGLPPAYLPKDDLPALPQTP